jgi:LacI family transcriptional regulator
MAPQKHLKNTSERAFPLKEIARQAGLSLATVDRAIHNRGQVRPVTMLRVKQALKELAQQGALSALSGRKFTIDLVMQAPVRFSSLVREALQNEMPKLEPAQFRCRFHLAEEMPPKNILAILRHIAKRGSNGVILKAPDVPEIANAIAELMAKGIPVITLVTDVGHSPRTAYVGIDNRAAGETAAYLIGRLTFDKSLTVLVTLSSNRFRGEEEREIGFRCALRERYPHLQIVDISEGFGSDRITGQQVRAVLDQHPDVAAVYSIGGGNRAIVKAFADAKRTCIAFVGHDLDQDNRSLLAAEKISAILHHDLASDMRLACQHIMRANRALGGKPENTLSQIQVITPFNIPL